MKKLFVFIGLMFLLGAYITPVNASPDVNIVVVTDDDKCEKCGKEECDGKCEVSAKSKVPATEKNAVKCDPTCKKACSTEKKSEKSSKEGCDEKKKGGKN